MKVFITHMFDGEDESFAVALKDDLDAAGLDGYMAEKAQRYDLMIHDKIMQAIDESEWLVAIITKQSQASPSVHEEIGYALGKGIRVALMVEKGVKERGVLIYGREPEVFASQDFGTHSKRVVESIRDSPRAASRQDSLGEAAKALLEKRRLLDVESADFAKNRHFGSLYSGSLSDSAKSVVLFTACPHYLVDRCDVTASEFIDWVESIARVDVNGQQVRIMGIKTAVDIETLTVAEKRRGNSDKNIMIYREFRSSGFLEWGTSYLPFDRDGRKKAELQLPYMIGELCAFLTYVRLFYKKIGLDAPFTLLLSIRNSHALDLGNYSGGALDDVERAYRKTTSNSSDRSTAHDHISLSHAFKSVHEMTDGNIASVAKKVAKDICNAYGEKTPKCYDMHEAFLWRLHDEVASRATGDGRI